MPATIKRGDADGVGTAQKLIGNGHGQRARQSSKPNRKGQPMKEVFANVVEGTTDGQPVPYKRLIA